MNAGMEKANKRPYDEDLAYKLMQSHQLAPSTVRNWKSRGYIPAQYFTDRPLPKRLSPNQKHLATQLRTQISPALLKQTWFNVIKGVHGKTIFYQKLREQYEFRPEELKALRNKVRLFIKWLNKQVELLQQEEDFSKALRTLAQHPGLITTEWFMQAGLGEKGYQQYQSWRKGVRKQLPKDWPECLSRPLKELLDFLREEGKNI
ncbi:MAG: hypothetical protein OHK0053_05640 [Microscillaceae bacterium]